MKKEEIDQAIKEISVCWDRGQRTEALTSLTELVQQVGFKIMDNKAYIALCHGNIGSFIADELKQIRSVVTI